MKTAIFSQFFINEKRVFSFNESHKNALKNAVFLMRGMFIFRMSFKWIFVFQLPMSFNNQLKMTKNWMENQHSAYKKNRNF